MTTGGNPLDASVESVVRDLWQGRVKTVVPVLAPREARDPPRGEQVLIQASQPATLGHAERSSAEQPARDSMRIGRDVMTLDADDVLRH